MKTTKLVVLMLLLSTVFTQTITAKSEIRGLSPRTDIDSFYRYDGTSSQNWTTDEITVAPDSWIAPTVIKNVKINKNSTIELGVNTNAGEPERLDYTEIKSATIQSVSNGIGRMEAEKMKLRNYEINTWDATASQSSIIKVSNSNNSASAAYTFTGPSAGYDIKIRYRDEVDGASFYTLKINGTSVHSWTADEITVAPDSWIAPTVIKNVKINKNSTIELVANANAGEPARLDYIEIKSTTIKSVSNGIGRMEAEKMKLRNYEINTWDATASQSSIIKVSNSNNSASAAYTFTGPSAGYDIKIRYRDEVDGASFYTLKINGTSVHSWTADEITVAPDSWIAPTVIKNVKINKNSTIELVANANAGEPARLDYIEIKSTTIQSVSNGIGRMEAEKMKLRNYEINTWDATASQSSIIKVSNSNNSASAAYTFTGPSAGYDIKIRYRDEVDGASFYTLKINGTSVHSWTADEITVAPDSWIAPTVIKNVKINKNSTIELVANANAGEPARLDYIEIKSATSSPKPKPNENALYVSTSGNDTNDGSKNNPFRTIRKAVQTVARGGLIYLRAGVYYPKKQLTINRAYGSKGARTRMFSYPGEKAVIDGSRFSDIAPNILNNNIFVHQAAFWHFKNLDIRNALNGAILISGNSADGNILENLNIYDNGNSGIFLYSGPSNTLVLNCDSYRNFDRQNGGQDADGFAAKFNVGIGNKFEGCRAWANSDDGWDFWMAESSVTIENCWAYKNGFDIWNFGSAFEGNGDGFKFGRGKGSHIIKNCVAWGNDLRGFNSNSNESNLRVYNCTAWNNDILNFGFSFGTGNFVLRNNLSFQGKLDIPSATDAKSNSWNLNVNVNENDFKSLSSSIAEGPRTANNELPVSNFLKLRNNSDLIDKGVKTVGIDFSGSAPDLGAFESLITAIKDSNTNTLAFEIYPNPVNDQLSLRISENSSDKIQAITVYDMQGRKHGTIGLDKLSSNQNTIDVTSFANGLYILSVNFVNKQTQHIQFVVKH